MKHYCPRHYIPLDEVGACVACGGVPKTDGTPPVDRPLALYMRDYILNRSLRRGDFSEREITLMALYDAAEEASKNRLAAMLHDFDNTSPE